MSDEATQAVSLPAIANSDEERASTWSGDAGGLLKQIFRDVEIRSSESETWGMDPDPWAVHGTGGPLLFTLSKMTFTKARATMTNGGYRAWWTFAGTLKVESWRTAYRDNPPAHLSFDIKNLQNGVLLNQVVQRHFLCRESGQLFLSQDFQPDVYEIFKKVTVSLVNTTFYSC